MERASERASNFVERNRQRGEATLWSEPHDRASWWPRDRLGFAEEAPAATWPVYLLLKSRLPSRHLSTPRMLFVFRALVDRVLARSRRERTLVYSLVYTECPATHTAIVRRSHYVFIGFTDKSILLIFFVKKFILSNYLFYLILSNFIYFFSIIYFIYFIYYLFYLIFFYEKIIKRNLCGTRN